MALTLGLWLWSLLQFWKQPRVRPRSAGPKLALFGGIVDRSSTPKLGFEGRHVPLRSCRGLVEFQSPSAAHGLRRDAGLVMKTAFLAPHAPRPCLPVWPCLGHACPRVLPVTTLHDDGLLGRAARRLVKKEKKKKGRRWFVPGCLRSSFGQIKTEAVFGPRSTEAGDRRVYRGRTLKITG